MKLLYNEWTLIIKLLEKVASDEKAAPTERLTVIEILKKLKEEKIGQNSKAGAIPPSYQNKQKDKLKFVQYDD